MRILLVGEYSRLHYTLAEGLRILGHEVVVASDGDGFKNYPRDIDLTRRGSGVINSLTSLISVVKKVSNLEGYDIIQVINPCFTTQNIRINQYLYKQLKKKNKKVFLGAFGDDSFWVRACMSNTVFKYSEFFVGGQSTNLEYNKTLIRKWIHGVCNTANDAMAKSADGIIACLYEYYKSYEPFYPDKLIYIPLPVNTDIITFNPIEKIPQKVKFFIGINKDRSEYKGTDIMEKALDDLLMKYPDQVIVNKVESVSYDLYQKMMADSHVVLDQLYSYSPAMNALLAMAQGKIVVGGGEPEMYELLGEFDNRPVINVYPTRDSVFTQLENLVLNKDLIPKVSKRSYDFVQKNHNYISVASQYLDFWSDK